MWVQVHAESRVSVNMWVLLPSGVGGCPVSAGIYRGRGEEVGLRVQEPAEQEGFGVYVSAGV